VTRAALVLAAAVAAAALAVSAAAASPYIDIRVSFKIVKSPVDGSRPLTAQGSPITNADLQSMLDVANDSLQTSYWRGYRFVMSEPPVEVGSLCSTCSTTNPSYWFFPIIYDPNHGVDHMLEFETAAKNNTVAYAWRTNAINVYINVGQGNGGVSSFPVGSASHDIVVFGGTVVDATFRPAFPGGLVHHELGHYFDLKHTFNSQPACVDTAAVSCAACPGGDDGISDTLLDRACGRGTGYALPGWEWLDIAHNNYGAAWLALPGQVAAVNRTYYNNMSYHNGGQPYGHIVLYELSEGQLDHIADIGKTYRSAVCSGRTWFVQVGGGGNGTSTTPYSTLAQGVTAANAGGGDIVLLRPGSYSTTVPINKPLTLRATRSGPVTITNPNPVAQR